MMKSENVILIQIIVHLTALYMHMHECYCRGSKLPDNYCNENIIYVTVG